MQEEVKHYKVKSLPTQLRPNSVYYVKATSQSAVNTYITDQNGFPFPLLDLTGGGNVGVIQSVTGTGVTGTFSNPIINISTFKSSDSGNLIEISSNDGKLFVKPITSPDGSIDIVSTASALELQLGVSLQTQIQNALQPGDNVSELINDAGYLTQDNVVEYANLAAFPVTGAIGTIYIALDTGFFWSWNGTTYVPSSAPSTGITGVGLTNYVGRWTSPTTIGTGIIRDNGIGVGIGIAPQGGYALSIFGNADISNFLYAKVMVPGTAIIYDGAGNLGSRTRGNGVIDYFAKGNASVHGTITFSDGFYATPTPGTETARFDTYDRRLGIRTTTPTEALDVNGNIRNRGFYYDETNSAGTAGKILSATSTGTQWINSPTGTITGSGTTNYLPKWTSSTALGDSPHSTTSQVLTVNDSGRGFINFATVRLSVQRAQSQIDFNCGNPGFNEPSSIISDNQTDGFEILSKGELALKTGATYSNEGLRVFSTGKLKFTQTPDTGTTSDFLLMRDTSGNVKQIAYPTIVPDLLTEQTIDSYIGSRLRPTNTLSNGFYVDRNVNGAVGYSAINQNTGNGAVSVIGTGIGGLYTQSTYIAKFGPNYYIPILAGKGGLLGTEEVFVGSTDGNDVSVLTGPAFASISRKFTVKANGQLEIQTTPSTGTTSDFLLMRDTSGNVKQITYPTIPTVGTWGALNYPTWTTGTPFVKMTAAGTFSLDTNTYLTSAVTAVTATSPITSSGGNTPVISTSMATNKLIGRSTAGVGVMEEITVGTGLTLSGGTLNASAIGGGIPHATAAGTDTYTATVTGVTAYADGDAYLIRFTNGNTTGATLNINSLGAITLYRNNDGVLIGGDIISGGEMICVYNSTTSGFQCIGTAPNSLFSYVTNADSVTLTKGMPVYAFGGTGDRMTVKRAYNTGDSTSAQTVGLVLSTSIATNQKGLIMMQGLLDGLSILPTSTWADGDTVYLGATAGTITNVKPYAPNHLVYLGIVTTSSNGAAGRMYVRVQNGYELDELHNVQAQSPSLKDTLWYDNTVSPAQWKTASIPTILGYTPVTDSRTLTINGTTYDLTADRSWTITAASKSINVVSTNTSAANASNTDYVYIVSGTTTITLPTAVANTNLYTIKRAGINTVSIATTSSQTIDGSTSPITINVQYTSLTLVSDGTNWNVI